jgi:hypothetical protein
MSRTVIRSPAGSPSAGFIAARIPSGFVFRSARSIAAAASAFTMIAGVAALGVPAQSLTAQTVGLTRVGAVDPANGFPIFYEDANGLRLQLCLTPGGCLAAAPNPALPVSFPANFPDESFYWSADGDMTGPSASLLYISALEAAFINGAVAAGDQMVFSRLRIRVTGLVDGATYTITHPYGTRTLIAGIDGPTPGTINVTEDIGTVPGKFDAVLTGNLGPFLVPVGFVSRVPGTFIADAATPVAFTGSPFSTNFVRISGPSAGTLFPAFAVNANTAQLNQLVLQGQITTRTGMPVVKAHITKTATETAIDVWATAPPGVLLSASTPGGLPITLTETGSSGSFFGRISLGVAANPTSVVVSNLSDLPPSVAPLTGLTDLVTIRSALFTIGNDLVVTAHSSNIAGNPALTVTGTGFLPRVLTSTGNGDASGAVGLAAGAPAPSSITVTSASGGTTTIDVDVQRPPVLANAGPDQTVAAGAAVSLSGLASTGPITSFSWTHNAGALITLLGANTATPSFTAPSPAAPLDITFTLTVRDAVGNAASDTVVVHVQTGAVVDIVTIAAGPRYVVNKNNWRVSGTASQRRGQTISVFLGTAGNTTRPIGTAVVDAAGAWSMQTPQGAGPAPAAADTTIWAMSSLGGPPATATFQRN